MAERSPLDYSDRIGRLEGITEQTNDRLGSLERRIDSLKSDLEAQIGSLKSDLERRIDRLEDSHRRDFRWLLGTMIGMWATMMGLLVTVTVKVFSG
ncbi:MAG: hypothetical protein F4Y91_18465 [Gemmatimonadetes bacterium]|nr:hypothetical protein [Gemmatimonadota bacterium]MXY83985.1 hypothetical protein [Gemmatimonadota bacterium]MYB70744.1 hypothetical protein [Gemmatimonadota bacterium]